MLPAAVNESSGLARSSRSGNFWTHNDSGGAAELYEVDTLGILHQTKTLAVLQNTDWEALTDSPDGRLFIGDFGNNRNKRQDLAVHVLDPQGGIETIAFSYADQPAFPPPAEAMNYDCEAFFFVHDSLHLFSKNWSKTNFYVRRYTLPATAGAYRIAPQDSLWINSPVTDATISPSGQRFALLTYSKILIFDSTEGNISLSRPLGCIKLYRKQAEAVLFLNETDLLVSNEQGRLYKLTARKRLRPY